MVPPLKKMKHEDPAAKEHEKMSIFIPKSRFVANRVAVQENNKGFKWSVLCESIVDEQMDNEEYLSFTIKNHMNEECDVWYCDATITLKVKHAFNDAKTVSRTMFLRFSPTDDKFVFQNILNTEDFIADPGFFNSEDICQIEFRIQVNSVEGKKFYKRQTIDWSEETTGSDVCLVVQGKKFFVGKHFLVRHATYFASMFYGGFKESVMETIELKDIDKVYFEMFLNYLHNFNGQTINTCNVSMLLELADRFECQTMLMACEKFILETREIDHIERFVLADKHRLYALKDRCLSNLVHADAVNELIDSPLFLELEEETRTLVTRKLSVMYNARKMNQQLNQQLNQYLGPSFNSQGPSTSFQQQPPFLPSRPPNNNPANGFLPYGQLNSYYGGPGPSRPYAPQPMMQPMNQGMNQNQFGFSNNPGPSNYQAYNPPPAPVAIPPPPPARKARKPRQPKNLAGLGLPSASSSS